MEIHLAAEQAFHIMPQIMLEVARDRVEQKKVNLIAGTVGALFSRPKPEEIQLVGVENRLEPFWHIVVSTRTAYDRQRAYTVNVSGAEVQSVTLLGQDIAVDPKTKAFNLTGLEHCLEERRASRLFDAVSGDKVDFSKHLAQPKTEIADVATFAPEGVLVVPPQVRATAVVQQVMAEVVKPVQAQVIHEERAEVETIALNFRPVYVFEID